jgi:UDP-glucuronate 4-epimerase
MKHLVTGAAGFIGYHVCERLLARGDDVVGLDNLNAYYDPALKRARLDRLNRHAAFRFEEIDLADQSAVPALFAREQFPRVIHLAAQAGVRYSVTHPHAYAASNLSGFLNVLEACRHHGVGHLTYASSSSVYGLNATTPFSERHNVDHPVSLYAATKKSNELMAHAYAHLYGMPVTGLRFFTVYGPWGRPDMAYFLFTRAILEGQPIRVFNHGKMLRDFTYIDDVADGVVKVSDRPATPSPTWSGAEPDPATSPAPYRLYNIGNNRPIELMQLIEAVERAVGKPAEKTFTTMQQGDVPTTFADIDLLEREFGYRPTTSIDVGIPRFVAWYREFYRV